MMDGFETAEIQTGETFATHSRGQWVFVWRGPSLTGTLVRLAGEQATHVVLRKRAW